MLPKAIITLLCGVGLYASLFMLAKTRRAERGELTEAERRPDAAGAALRRSLQRTARRSLLPRCGDRGVARSNAVDGRGAAGGSCICGAHFGRARVLAPLRNEAALCRIAGRATS